MSRGMEGKEGRGRWSEMRKRTQKIKEIFKKKNKSDPKQKQKQRAMLTLLSLHETKTERCSLCFLHSVKLFFFLLAVLSNVRAYFANQSEQQLPS